MPTPSKANVEAARSAVLARLRRAGSGEVVDYFDIARGFEAACPSLTPQRARHALRAAVDALAGEGMAEPWGRRLRDGRWACVWLGACRRTGGGLVA